jgi:AraC-like DNA-binding protein
MKNPANIRQLYTPIQPNVKQAANDVMYQEFLPSPALQSYIYCYWQLKTIQTLSEQFNYRVVADGCIDIFFELDNPQENFVMGFCKKFTEFPLNNTFNYAGVRFLPTAFPQLFKINASELSNRFEDLSIVLPELSRFIKNNFNPQNPPQEITGRLDRYLVHLLSNVKIENDARLGNALDLILQNGGVVDIEKGLDTGLSPRQLRRLFEFYIGDSAKTFSQIVRFQNFLRAKPSSHSLRKDKLFFDVGYYDQAHFIREFKNFYGVTPGKAFGE